MTDTTQPPAETHPCWRDGYNRRAHRHWFRNSELQPTCERCGTSIDREHNEVGPVCWTPPKKPGADLWPIWREVQAVNAVAFHDDITAEEYRARMIAVLSNGPTA